jgi:arginine deiminase
MSSVHSMVSPLLHVAVKAPNEAFRSREAVEAQWKALDYLSIPDIEVAQRHHKAFVDLVTHLGAKAFHLPADDRAGLDSLYVHDPVLVTDGGAIIFQTGKPARRGEGPAFEDVFKSWGVPILGRIDGNATAEAGDMLWLDRRTLLVGRGFRTNYPGLVALRSMLKELDVEVVPFDMPVWHGVNEVLHLQSFISLLDDDLAVVYRKLLPVAMYELLEARGVKLIDVPDEEYDSLACNILTIAPRQVVMVAGNPVTRARVADAGCKIAEFDGSQICIPGSGGPTCLTRPIRRA